MVFLVKKYETGVMSKYVHEQLKVGDTLAIKGPFPKFPYKGACSPYRKVPMTEILRRERV